ncbi:MAG: TonB-dependent receptor [Steroidobacteraceae bacterium]
MGRIAGVVMALGLMLGVAGAVPAAESDQLADVPLDQLLDMSVAGSSRFAQRRSEAAAAVSVITRQDIRAHGYRTLGEALRAVRGVNVISDRVYEYLGVRGFLDAGDYNTRVLLLIDGNRVNDPLYDQAAIGSEFPLDLEMVERIEFIPGQGSALYGANALFGTINVITREAPRAPEFSGSLGLGSGAARRVSAALRGPIGDGGLSVQFSRSLADGLDLYDPARADGAGADGWSRHTDFERRSALFVRWDRGGFSANLVHGDRLKGDPYAIFLMYGDPANRYRDRHTGLNLEWNATPASGLRSTVRAFAGEYTFIGDYRIDYPPPTRNRDIARARWFGGEARLRYEGAGRQRIAGGIEWQRTPGLLQRNFDLEPAYAGYLDDQRADWRLAAYAEDQLRLGAGWSAELGLRVDRAHERGAQWSPRIALGWEASERLSLKLVHGGAFRPPNAFQAYYASPGVGGYVRNPDLRSETVRGEELLADWRLAPAWRLSGSLFHNRASGLMSLGSADADGQFRFSNLGRLDADGMEVEIERADARNRLRVNYTLTRISANAAASDAGITRFPRRMLKASASRVLAREWSLAAQAVAVSARGAAPAQLSVDLDAGGPLCPRGPELHLSLRNLLDRRLFDPGSDPEAAPRVPEPGRTWMLEVSWPLAL